MATFTPENRQMFQSLFDSVAPKRPDVGKRVTVNSGKHKRKCGIVTWHGVNKFSDAWRYGNDAEISLREAMGKFGYRVRIQPDEGEPFFVEANNVTVVIA
jgi:hypothetical protein